MADVSAYPIALPDNPIVWRGDPFNWTLQMGADGSTVDLTGFGTTWAAQLRSSPTWPTVAADFAVDVSHLAAGYVVLSLTGEQTAALTGRYYRFDVQASGGTESPFTVWCGRISMQGDYTRG